MFIIRPSQVSKNKLWVPFLVALLAGAMIALSVSSSLARKGRPVASTQCNLTAETDWEGGFNAMAQSSGDCDAATLELTISNARGDILWVDGGPSELFFGFDDATSPDMMLEALNLWIGDYASTSTTGTLPDWLAGEEFPVPSEFPFYVDEEISRDSYLAIRAADRTMICYIQGRESMRCLTPTQNGLGLEGIGVQSFPG